MNNYFTIMEETDGRIWALNIHGETKADSERAIRWQHTGGNYQAMHVCTFDKDAREFVSLEGRRFAFPLTRGIYTVKAWDEFKARLDIFGTFTVIGSHGELAVDLATGLVVAYAPDSPESTEYADIVRFNLRAIHNDGQPVRAGQTFDINDCEYTTATGHIEPALPVDWREAR